MRRSRIEWRRHDDTDFEAITEDWPIKEDTFSRRNELRITMGAMGELPERTRIALHMHRSDAD